MMRMMRMVVPVAIVSLMAMTAQAQAPAPAPALGTVITIEGKDTNWHLIADTLEVGKCYQVTLASTVLYAPGQPHPTRLRISTKGAAKVEQTWESAGKKVIQQTFSITASGPQLVLRLVDIDATDNTGKLRVKVEPCPGAATPVAPKPAGS